MSWGYKDKEPQTWGLKQQNLLSSTSEGQKSEIQLWAGWSSLQGLQGGESFPPLPAPGGSRPLAVAPSVPTWPPSRQFSRKDTSHGTSGHPNPGQSHL